MPKRYHIIFNLLALFVVIYLGVDAFYTVVRARLTQVDTRTFVVQQLPDDKGREKPPLGDYRSIIDRNIFGSADRTAEEVDAAEIEGLEPTSLKIALLGTVTGNQRHAVAVIEETAKRKQGLYKVGDSIQDATIKMILRGKVILKVEDRDEILTMEEAAAQKTKKGPLASRPPGKGNIITVSRSDIARSLKNINKLMSEARIRPHFKGGKPDGLVVSKIKKDSVFAKLGLRNGDIVQGINDKSIKSLDDILGLYKKLKSGSRVQLQLNRKGERKNIDYEFR